MKKNIYLFIVMFAAKFLFAQQSDSLISKKKIIHHAFYKKGDWYLSTGVYAQTVLNTFQASSLAYTQPRASYWHETNQTAFIPLVGIKYMVADRWGIHYLPAIRKTLIMDTLTTGTVVGSIWQHGKWIVDHHAEVTWFTNKSRDLKHSARHYLGAGISVMNAFQSFREPKEPALLGRKINMTYGAVTLFGGIELTRYSKLLHRLYIEPRLMIIPSMPRYTLEQRGPYYMFNLRIYKDLFLKNTRK